MRLVRDPHLLQRHMSQHPGGMVISTQPLDAICPIQPAAMDGRQMVQWDKESCADAGFLKIDLLGLGMLSAVERCVDEIARVRGQTIDLSRIDWDDKQVYAEIQAAETMGVFQIESRAQMQMLKRTLPESLDDLTVQVALVRPGPIQGGAVHPYIERRKALRADPSFQIPYEHPSLEPVLRDTLGAIVFQDQVIEVAMVFAGFSPGEAEGLRRAMSRKRSEEAMRAFEEKFVTGGLAVRVGLGYVAGVSAEDVRAIVDERSRGGPFSSVEQLASRCATRVDALERLAWAGALDPLVAGGRREALWLLGVAAPGVRVAGGTQLALPVEVEAPQLAELSPWERMLADYGSTRVTLREHPLALMRPGLGEVLTRRRRGWASDEAEGDRRGVVPAAHSFGRRG